jgi:hypothetical protein
MIYRGLSRSGCCRAGHTANSLNLYVTLACPRLLLLIHLYIDLSVGHVGRMRLSDVSMESYGIGDCCS